MTIIHEHSPNSYLLMNREVPETTRNISPHACKLEKSMRPYTFEDLEPLKTVYLIHFEDQDIISKIRSNQKELADKLSVELEVR